MTLTDEQTEEAPVVFAFTESVVLVVALGAVLALGAKLGAVPLLVAVALVQAALAPAVLWGLAVPGRKGGLVLAGLAAAGADVAVSAWPHARLGTLLPVLGVAVPLLIAHQLLRGAARVRVLESLGFIAILVTLEIAIAAYVQLRHEIVDADTAGTVVFAAVLAIGAALAVGLLTDLVLAAPRFDADVPRGLLALVLGTAVGTLTGYLTLRDVDGFAGSRGLFVGGALAALAGLVAIGVAFTEASAPAGPGTFGRRVRPLLAATVPLAVLGPVAFLFCLAVRS